MGDLQMDLAQLVSRAKHADTSKPSRRARSETYLATDMPSSYGEDDSAHALGAIHIDPDSWTPNLPRDATFTTPTNSLRYRERPLVSGATPPLPWHPRPSWVRGGGVHTYVKIQDPLRSPVTVG
jgi:hypothetical protein